MTVFSLGRAWTCDANKRFSKSRYSPFRGVAGPVVWSVPGAS